MTNVKFWFRMVLYTCLHILRAYQNMSSTLKHFSHKKVNAAKNKSFTLIFKFKYKINFIKLS